MSVKKIVILGSGGAGVYLPTPPRIIEEMKKANIEVVVVDSDNKEVVKEMLDQQFERPATPITAPYLPSLQSGPEKSGKAKRRDKRKGKAKYKKWGWK